MITVYKLPSCHHCDRTTELLDILGVEYWTVDLSENHEAREYVRDHLGYSQAPVVVTEDDSWSGFKPDRIRELVG